jgi:hypothetical protein
MKIRNLFAIASVMLLATLVTTANVRADDDLLTALAAAESNSTESLNDFEEDEMGMADVESLINDGEEEVDESEAVAACYRRFGRSYGFRSYGYRSYGYSSYRSCYTPSFYSSYRFHTPSYCYTPITYSYCTPVYSNYWGCW